jgi:hypothetical protein
MRTPNLYGVALDWDRGLAVDDLSAVVDEDSVVVGK